MGVGAWAGARDVSAGATAATEVAPKFWGRPLNKCFLFLFLQKSSLNFRKCLNWHFDQAEVGYKHSESEISNFYVQKSKFYYGFQYNVQFSLIWSWKAKKRVGNNLVLFLLITGHALKIWIGGCTLLKISQVFVINWYLGIAFFLLSMYMRKKNVTK